MDGKEKHRNLEYHEIFSGLRIMTSAKIQRLKEIDNKSLDIWRKRFEDSILELKIWRYGARNHKLQKRPQVLIRLWLKHKACDLGEVSNFLIAIVLICNQEDNNTYLKEPVRGRKSQISSKWLSLSYTGENILKATPFGSC